MKTLLFVIATTSIGQVPTSSTSQSDLAAIKIHRGADVKADDVQLQSRENWWAIGAWSAGITGTIFLGGTRAWWDQGYEEFKLRETGWLGKDTYSGGHDKIGHMWSGYTLLHTLAYIYKFHGMSQEGAMWMSVVMSTLVMNGFEFVDGFTQFGFEYADAIANTAGIALGALTWIYPSLFDLISFRLAYVPTNDFLDNETSLVKFINDYSGQIYYLDIRGHGVNQLLNRESDWTKYLLAGVAFSTNHYSPVRRNELRQRLWGAHVGLDTSKLLEDILPSNTGNNFVRNFFNYYALPFLSVAVFKDLNSDFWSVNFGLSNRLQATF
ncbi:MAG: DUF2279 domain-containing protein [Myxococcota bacterium]|nr:DUF2279 domain-containing protein [Myxococcota bacterium]